MAKTKKKKIKVTPLKGNPCPPGGPAHDGRGKGRGMPGGSRRGLRNSGWGNGRGRRAR